MQEVFENIIKKLESLENVFIKGNSHNVAAGISRAIEIVKQEAEQYTSTVHSEYYEKGFEDGAESVRSIAQYQDIGWIPCSVAMPEGYKQYDITTKNDAGIHSDTAIFNPFVGMWFWDEAENNPIEIEVLAWAEKRGPYQPKGE